MQKVVKFLASMKLTSILIVAVVATMLAGGFLTSYDEIYHAFKEMNDMIILDWLLKWSTHNTVVAIWFVILVVFAVALGINLVLCSWDNLLKSWLKTKSLKQLTLFLIHFVFIIIMLLHAVAFFVGYKYGNIVLKEGDEFAFEDNYVLKLERIEFVDNPEILRKKKCSSRLDMTSDKFHYKDSYVCIQLYEDGEKLAEGEMRIFEPFYFDGIQFTSEKYLLTKKSDKLAVKMTISKNPFAIWFFIFYGIGIALMLFYLIIRWKK